MRIRYARAKLRLFKLTEPLNDQTSAIIKPTTGMDKTIIFPMYPHTV